ncbi:hypothetical protein HOF65_07330 [bacterium]|nr:hypothetical protein [bacterium]
MFSSLLIIFTKSSSDNIITSISVLAFTVAFLFSSLRNAISQKISPEVKLAILSHFT